MEIPIMYEDDLDAASSLIQELYDDVSYWEAPLSGGSKLSIGAETINDLKETRVTFGNPRDSLVKLTKEGLEQAGVKLTLAHETQLDGSNYKFYLLTLTVNLRSRPSLRFQSLYCMLDFGPKGIEEPIVQTIFPTNRWRSVIGWGGRLVLGLDGNLDWRVGLPQNISEHIQDLPADLSAQVTNANRLRAFIALPDYSFDIGRLEVAAYGEGGSECYWRINEPQLQETSTAKFAVVFKVPVSVDSITLKGTVWAEPKMDWLATNLRDVFADLKPHLQQLFNRNEDASNKLSKGSVERWHLQLPT